MVCPQYDSSLDSNCQGRPWEITFRYNGGGCSQSDNLQPRQRLVCTDTGEGAPRAEGTQSYITAIPRGGTDVYFAGPVAVGEKYTLNQDRALGTLSTLPSSVKPMMEPTCATVSASSNVYTRIESFYINRCQR
jgi:hypothetical protein